MERNYSNSNLQSMSCQSQGIGGVLFLCGALKFVIRGHKETPGTPAGGFFENSLDYVKVRIASRTYSVNIMFKLPNLEFTIADDALDEVADGDNSHQLSIIDHW